MVRSDSADEEYTGKLSCADDDDETGDSNNDSRGKSAVGVGGKERRMRRQIANCNERRRMQSINAGFQSLRAMLPRSGEKTSKAAVLQQTVELIQKLQADKLRLLNEKLEREKAERLRLVESAATDDRLVEQLSTALERERRMRLFYEQQLSNRVVGSEQCTSEGSLHAILEAIRHLEGVHNANLLVR